MMSKGSRIQKIRTVLTRSSFLLFMLCCIFTLTFLGCNPAQSKSQNNDSWKLIWSDEFNGTGSPDPAKWETLNYNRRNNDTGPDGWWSSEDAYLDGQGNLVIRVRKIDNQNSDDDAFDYSSGMVRSRGRFEQKFGKFEIRCQMPSEPGWWVAFWLMCDSQGDIGNGGEDGTEIDIMEGFGWTERIGHALHWDGYGAAHQSAGDAREIPGILDGFHTFTLEWDETQYIFSVDGQETWRTTAGGVSKVPEYIKVTGEISTESWAITGDWAGDPLTAAYPDYFVVDYVRVYTKDSAPTPTPGPNGVIFYQDVNFNGTATRAIPKGTYTLSQLKSYGFINDWASSVKIPPGWRLIMYADDNFRGNSWNLTGNIADFSKLSPDANDVATSCRIQ